MRVFCCTATAVVCAVSTNVSAQTVRLTFEEALARARDQSPAVMVARARVEEGRGRLVGARRRFRENPTIEAFAGPRRSDAGTTADLDVGISQLFETGGQRAARIAGADATIAAELAAAQDARRRTLEAVALAFLRTLHATERIQLLAAAEDTAHEVLRVATRRYESGDIAILDVISAKPP